MCSFNPYIKTFMNKQIDDLVIEQKTCAISGKQFSVFQSDLDFYKQISPTFAGQKFAIPTPTLCPEERQRRRLAFRNERNLYRRTCDASGKQIISIYSPDKPHKVYDQKIRLLDSRDPMDYWREFNFNKTFVENFKILVQDVPKKWLVSEYNENCEYTSICGYCKDCYLISASERSEKCYYGNLIQDSDNIVDGSFIYNCSHVYNSVNCHNCFNSKYILNCKDCADCIQCYNLIWCSFCYQCYDLQNQKYCINNRQYSKEDYLQKMATEQWNLTLSVMPDLILKSTHKVYEGYNNENVSWKYINNSKDIENWFDIEKWEFVRHSQIVVDGKSLYDCTNVYIENEMSLEIMSALSSKFNIYSWFIYNCNNCLYSLNLSDSNNCFGCDGLRNKSYCIFNKQYTKDEYEKTVAKIITHMQDTGERWEFFHPSVSPFGYNETVAQEYYPLQKEQSLVLWYQRSDYEAPKPSSDKTIQWSDLPATIQEVQDTILQYAIACETTGRIFRIQSQELAFYRKHAIPLPRKHPDQRHIERLLLRK